ncbi:MAG: M23 family metallopeptidase [Bacteroidota bacterium]|nr:M23 family metallopeptidase [Bacteroidota bacterium]
MPEKRLYTFDNESCSFVEVVTTPWERARKYAWLALFALLVGAAATLTLDRVIDTPEELALLDENRALHQQLTSVGDRLDAVTQDLMDIRETDEELYRVLLNAQGISDDVAQVGVGGSNPYPEFSRFSEPTARVLTDNAGKIDRLERLLMLQSSSYRELTDLAEEHQDQLREMPAIQPVNGRITSGFGIRFHPVLKVRRMHPGLDFHAPVGTPIYSTGDGVIDQARSGSGLGRYVKVLHETAGYLTVYAHMSKIAPGIREGRTIKRGDLIGYSGNTGLSEAPHLHYEVRDLDGNQLNPIHFLAPSMTPAEYERLLAQAESTTFIFD